MEVNYFSGLNDFRKAIILFEKKLFVLSDKLYNNVDLPEAYEISELDDCVQLGGEVSKMFLELRFGFQASSSREICKMFIDNKFIGEDHKIAFFGFDKRDTVNRSGEFRNTFSDLQEQLYAFKKLAEVLEI